MGQAVPRAVRKLFSINVDLVAIGDIWDKLSQNRLGERFFASRYASNSPVITVTA